MTANPTAEELRELYRELILDHAKAPRHFGKLEEPSHQAEGINPLCGDKLKLYLHLDDAGVIDDITFEGSGCAISVASASLLTETVLGMPVGNALERSADVVQSLTGDTGGSQLGKLAALQGVREFPARVKCATLAWRALDAAIKNDNQPATTE
jgi:nitrogen fixation NifU-like protein